MFFGQPFGGLFPGARGAVLSVLLRTGAPLTGRQVYTMVSDDFSLWSVQQALKALTKLGIVETATIGRAGVHTVNEDHFAVPHLRALADPMAALKATVEEAVDSGVEAVIIFGSVARAETGTGSDIDLAAITNSDWDGRSALQDTIRRHLGNECDVLVFTGVEFRKLAGSGEPVVRDIVRDGVALVGTMPRVKSGAS